MAGHVCPWWLGLLHALPIPRLIESPVETFGADLRSGMRVLDINRAERSETQV